jgi:hypothetical protein
MRKLGVALAIAILAAATATVALAASEISTFSVKHSAKAEGASTGITFKTTFADPDAATGLPSGVKAFTIKLHKGTKIDAAGATQCKATDDEITSKGSAACPAASRIGKGTATATPPTGGAGTTVGAVIFNEKVGGRNAFLFMFVNDQGAYVTAFDAFVKGNTLSASGLDGAIPGGLIVTKFNGTIDKHSKGKGKKKHNLITAPGTCPKSKKWTNSGTFTFQNGDKDTATSTSACKP